MDILNYHNARLNGQRTWGPGAADSRVLVGVGARVLLPQSSFAIPPQPGQLPSLFLPFVVPRQQRAHLQQYEVPAGKVLGSRRDSSHGHRPLCLHGHR